jgi:hypothetical protein
MTQCRAASGQCALPAYCDGASRVCPNSTFASTSVVCRAAQGPCDVVERCTGSTASCPVDAMLNGTVCRGAVGACDVTELCDGRSALCPPDAYRNSSTVCRQRVAAPTSVDNNLVL